MKTILVVDDNQNIGLLYKEELEDDGYQVTVTPTGKEALQKLDNHDLIILDIKNPAEDSMELMRKIKDDKGDIPIIICSAYGRYKQDFRVWASDATVVKSTDLRELKLTIKEIFNQRKAG